MPNLYRAASYVRLSDFAGGVFENEMNRQTVPATALARKMMMHFETPAKWEDFGSRSKGQATFDALRQAGILICEADADNFQVISQAGLTMFDAPHRKLSDLSRGEIVFIGAPLDIGTTGYPGARYGPDALRAASQERYRCDYDPRTGGLKPWNMPGFGGAILKGAKMSDAGNVRYRPGTAHQDYYDGLRNVTDQVRAAGAFPVVLGGDHSILYSTADPNADTFLHLDAHSDMASFEPTRCHHHGNVITRLVAEHFAPQIVHVGLRDTSGSDTARAGSWAYSADPRSLPSLLDRFDGSSVYISLDVDVFDPRVIPGTGTPVPGGFSLQEVCDFLAQLPYRARITGLDVVELCPMRDIADQSARSVVEVILVFLAAFHLAQASD